MLDSYSNLITVWENDKKSFSEIAMKLIMKDSKRRIEKSYLHENGFSKITLDESEDRNVALRLHIWPKKSAESNLHGHCFNLRSYVMNGNIVDRIYRESDSGVTMRKFDYSRRDLRQSYSLTYLGEKYVELQSEKNYRDGDRYNHHYDVIHSSEIISCGACTLFMADKKNAKNSTVVYSNRYSSGENSINSPSMSFQDILRTIESIA